MVKRYAISAELAHGGGGYEYPFVVYKEDSDGEFVSAEDFDDVQKELLDYTASLTVHDGKAYPCSYDIARAYEEMFERLRKNTQQLYDLVDHLHVGRDYREKNGFDKAYEDARTVITQRLGKIFDLELRLNNAELALETFEALEATRKNKKTKSKKKGKK
jgi:hypothetical protein